jgi:hypothetical protein
MLKATYSVRDSFKEKLSKRLRYVEKRRKSVQETLQRAVALVKTF